MNKLGFRLRIFLIILLVIVITGTVGFMVTEKLSLADALYFSIVTVATVGYGDISPVTAAGKVLSIFLIVTGVGTFLGVVANATELLLNKQEQKARMEKLNMVISAFFSEVGTGLLAFLAAGDPTIDSVAKKLNITNEWSEQDFSSATKRIRNHEFSIDVGSIDLKQLTGMIQSKGGFFLRLLENPSILEHESFTDLLRALLHLKEELLCRGDFNDLPQSDLNHIAVDIKRAYSLLSREWIDYMKHLKQHYPYLFSLATRMNPFDRNRSPVVT